MFISIGPSVKSFDVFIIQVDGGGRVFDDFVPIAKRIVTGGSIRVEDWVWFAENGLAVQVYGIIVILVAVSFVACLLQLPRNL